MKVDKGNVTPAWSDEDLREQRIACHWCTPVVVDGFAYLSSGEKNAEAELRCVELSCGKVHWSKRGMGRCNLLYADAHLVCLTDFGSLSAIKAVPDELMIVAEYHPDKKNGLVKPCYAAPILSHGLLFVRDAKRVYCFDLAQDKR